MTEQEAQQQISEWLQADHFRMQVLRTVQTLGLPECYVAAGFLRNLVWDQLHQKASSELNDIDILYFNTVHSEDEKYAEHILLQQFPTVSWDVKNQARMHLKHQHTPYASCAEAMSCWPEKETAVGVRLGSDQRCEFIAPWGLSFLFDCCITWNTKRPLSLFQQRVESKQWLARWPRLTLRMNND
ncbi:nucleotidyltransferase family protein [Planctobacterium marinum]|uniref:Nitrate reductase n=1 Tax=Planctobacterium marinum TaxID=1631968 RepID=A0AA48HZA8_9ALTE|nr:hypothetical protein MACH26_41290 [Planctobacterium marinum]